MATTVPLSRPTRRVVRDARQTLDAAWDVALAELPTELRPLVRKYAETNQAAYAARYELSTALTRSGSGIRWADVDRLVRSLD